MACDFPLGFNKIRKHKGGTKQGPRYWRDRGIQEDIEDKQEIVVTEAHQQTEEMTPVEVIENHKRKME